MDIHFFFILRLSRLVIATRVPETGSPWSTASILPFPPITGRGRFTTTERDSLKQHPGLEEKNREQYIETGYIPADLSS